MHAPVMNHLDQPIRGLFASGDILGLFLPQKYRPYGQTAMRVTRGSTGRAAVETKLTTEPIREVVARMASRDRVRQLRHYRLRRELAPNLISRGFAAERLRRCSAESSCASSTSPIPPTMRISSPGRDGAALQISIEAGMRAFIATPEYISRHAGPTGL